MATVRLWKPEDTDQCMRVLKEASWSNVMPSFFLTIRKGWFAKITVVVVVGCFYLTYNVIFALLSMLVVILVTLIIQVIGSVCYIYMHLKDMKDVKKEYFSNPDSCFMVATVKFDNLPSVIVGTIAVVRRSPSSKIVWLRRMAVLKEFRGYGVGQILVEKAIDFAKELDGVNKIMLITTEVHKASRTLYTKMGFKYRNYRPYPYYGGLIKIWTYEMEYILNSS